jgi:hypothetical protein
VVRYDFTTVCISHGEVLSKTIPVHVPTAGHLLICNTCYFCYSCCLKVNKAVSSVFGIFNSICCSFYNEVYGVTFSPVCILSQVTN